MSLKDKLRSLLNCFVPKNGGGEVPSMENERLNSGLRTLVRRM